jgi:hypothetical protein
MSGRIAYYGGIVTNGLVLNLDAAKKDSYAGSGTVWRDISRNNYSGSLINGPTFNSANGGSIRFDGVDDYYTPLGGTFNYSPGTTGEVSLELWVYPTGPYTAYGAEPPTTNLAVLFGQGIFANTTGWGIGVQTTSGVNYFAFQVRNLGNITSPTSSFTNNNWYHVVGTFTRNENTRLYVNGTLMATISNTNIGNLTITPSTNDAAIGRGGFLPLYAGSITSTARIYNKPLSAAEVLQNYNATKGRFGL